MNKEEIELVDLLFKLLKDVEREKIVEWLKAHEDYSNSFRAMNE